MALLLENEVTSQITALANWLNGGVHIKKSYQFKSFKDALVFTNAIAEIAEEFGHHPDLGLGWGYVNVSFTTHALGGLTQKDFDMANKTDNIYVVKFGG